MPPTILLVEDDPALRYLVAECLGLIDADVIECSTADEALKVLQNPNVINLVLTDVRMPGQLDGLDLAHLIWATWPELPVVLTSGHLTLVSRTVPANATFIAKPWSLDTLLQAVVERLG